MNRRVFVILIWSDHCSQDIDLKPLILTIDLGTYLPTGEFFVLERRAARQRRWLPRRSCLFVVDRGVHGSAGYRIVKGRSLKERSLKERSQQRRSQRSHRRS